MGAADTCAETLRKSETCSFKSEKVGAQSENSDEIVPQEAGVISRYGGTCLHFAWPDSDERFWRLCLSKIYCTNSVHKLNGGC